MINFNIPPFTGKETEYMAKATTRSVEMENSLRSVTSGLKTIPEQRRLF